MALLEVRNLSLHYATARGPLHALDAVSLSVEGPGEAVGIIGESGSGKSSLAMAILRVLPPNVALLQGEVRLDGVELLGMPAEAFRRDVRWKKIAAVFQGAMNAFNPVLKMGVQIGERLLLDGGIPRREAYREVERLIERVGLPSEVFHRYPHELSGGMRQRAAIAMALTLRPRLLLLDEPTSALDVSVQAQILNLLKELKRDLGISMVFITHDIALASDLCDRLAVLHAGEVREEGPAEAVLERPLDPYTQVLLAGVPRLSGATPPRGGTGAPPDMVAPPPGCRFAPRCPYAMGICSHRPPPLLEPQPGRRVRCWLHAPAAHGG